MAFWKAGLAAIAIAGLGACGGGANGGTSAANGNTASGGTAANAAAVTANTPAEVSAVGSTAAIAASAFYVSPYGSDSYSGRSTSAPFKTLEKARDEMEATGIKTVYLMSGTWYRTYPLTLTSRDEGQSWLAYPGQTPVINGEYKGSYAIGIRGNYITVRFLTIESFVEDGIVAQNVNGAWIDSNKVEDIRSWGFSQGAILLQNTIENTTVSHNVIYNTQYGGVVAVNSAGNVLSNIKVEYNNIQKVCSLINDCGAIYFTNHDHSARGVVINNNIVGNYGTWTNHSKALYLDDEMSYATLENNVVYGDGTWAIQIHGGNNNTFKNNIFDITHASAFAIYQWDGATYPKYGMEYNEIHCNIVYSSAKEPYMLWKYDLASGVGLPSVSQNIYWGTQLSAANFGTIHDSAPIWKNPEFANPGAADYAFKAGTPSGCGFVGFSTAAVGLQKN